MKRGKRREGREEREVEERERVGEETGGKKR